MKIAILSDQHGELPEIPSCDLLILSGDITGGPTHIEGLWHPELSDDYWYNWLNTKFITWIADIPHVIMIGGNHDTAIEKYGMPLAPNITYLQDSGCSFNGYNFWGMPWIPRFDDLAFNLNAEQFRQKCALIPNNTDILLCHAPPFSILDKTNAGVLVGSIATLKAIERVIPFLVTCGHIHEARGVVKYGQTLIVNSALAFSIVNILRDDSGTRVIFQ